MTAHRKKEKAVNGQQYFLTTSLSYRLRAAQRQNDELDEKRKAALKDHYEAATGLEDAKGLIVKLTAQMNHDYENSSLPSSKCINRKNITNNREKSGKKPGAQAGHPHHPCKAMKPDKVVEIQTEERFKENPRYVPTGNIVSRQVSGICAVPMVTEYRRSGDRRRELRWFPESFPFSFEQQVQCIPEENDPVRLRHHRRGTLAMRRDDKRSVPGILFKEQDDLFRALLDSPVMHMDGTAAGVNGTNNNVAVCSNGIATMYFAREHKGHAGIIDTPVETFGGSLIHDHEVCFYSYGSDHQECLVHIERYIRDSIENEKGLTWNRQMLELIQEMIHENNIAPAEGMAEEKTAGVEARYDAIVQAATKKYEDDSPSEYYRDGYNLYRRMAEYRHDHLLFLSNPLVEPDNNLCERKARILKGKINQAISLRSFGQLTYFCECLSVLDHFVSGSMDNLYRSVKEVFERPRSVMSVSENPGFADTILLEYKAG